MSKRRQPANPAARQRAGLAAAKPAGRPRVADVFVARPFAGLPDEPDWVALRELVPAATAPLALNQELTARYGPRQITLATVLPMAWPALVKPDGRIFVGVQRNTRSGDVSRDVALSLLLALEASPGASVSLPPLPGPGPRLQDILDGTGLAVTVHDGFEFWLDADDPSPQAQAGLDRANAAAFPTVRLDSAPAAYWCRFPGKAHLRWVLSAPEEAALTTLARLAAAGELALGEQTRFAGMFRAHGLLVPVWDLPRDVPAQEWEQPLAQLAQRYAAAAEITTDLDASQRRARQGLVARQLSLR